MKQRTYILAPNFQYKPSGPIQIGNIIADPFRPTKILSTVPADKALVVETVIEHDHELGRQKSKSFGTSIWGQFLNSIGANVNFQNDGDSLQEYYIDRLETHYLRDEPSGDDAEMMKRLAEPRVQAAVNAGLFGRGPIYMITGLKIARGLSVHTEIGKTRGGRLGSGIPLTESLTVGAAVKVTVSDKIVSSFKSGDEDVIFAYQLHKIKRKSKATKARVTIGVFESDSAFLHDEEGKGRSEPDEAEFSLLQVEDLLDVDDGDGIESSAATDADGASCTCIQVKSKR